MKEQECASSFDQFTSTDKYIVSSELRDAVNVAIALQRPLLVKGEPGTGKTLLAHNIARALGKLLFVWNIKSTTGPEMVCMSTILCNG